MSDFKECDKCGHRFSFWERWDKGYFQFGPLGGDELCKNCAELINDWIKRDVPIPSLNLEAKDK